MKDAPDLDWDNIRLFQALAATGSLRQAAIRLGISHPTVRRRLEAFEHSLDLKLFHRRPGGLDLTVEGRELLRPCRGVEHAVAAVLRQAGAASQALSGPVRVSLPTGLAVCLGDALVALQADCPGIELNLHTSNHFVDLTRSQADLAIRGYATGQSPDEDLIAHKLTPGSFAVYGDAEETPYWIGAMSSPARTGWVASDAFRDLPIRSVIPEEVPRRAACVAGLGIAALPCILADGLLPRLTEPSADYDVWLLVHPDLRRTPRVRLVREFLTAEILKLAGPLCGMP